MGIMALTPLSAAAANAGSKATAGSDFRIRVPSPRARTTTWSIRPIMDDGPRKYNSRTKNFDYAADDSSQERRLRKMRRRGLKRFHIPFSHFPFKNPGEQMPCNQEKWSTPPDIFSPSSSW
jgi:hypothetical protein